MFAIPGPDPGLKNLGLLAIPYPTLPFMPSDPSMQTCSLSQGVSAQVPLPLLDQLLPRPSA